MNNATRGMSLINAARSVSSLHELLQSFMPTRHSVQLLRLLRANVGISLSRVKKLLSHFSHRGIHAHSESDVIYWNGVSVSSDQNFVYEKYDFLKLRQERQGIE